MYVRTGRRVRRPMYGLGWTGGFTLPGSTTRYSTETCTGSAAQPMTGGNMICGMDNESAYLTGIGCAAVGFRGQNSCSTDAGNAGTLFCCPPAALQQALARQGGTPGATPPTPDSPIGPGLGITTTQIVALAGIAAVIGVFGYFLTKKEPGPTDEELLFGSEG